MIEMHFDHATNTLRIAERCPHRPCLRASLWGSLLLVQYGSSSLRKASWFNTVHWFSDSRCPIAGNIHGFADRGSGVPATVLAAKSSPLAATVGMQPALRAHLAEPWCWR